MRDGDLDRDPTNDPEPERVKRKTWTRVYQGAVIPKAYGLTRTSSVCLYRGDFTADTISYSLTEDKWISSHSAPAVLGICQAPIGGTVRKVWKGFDEGRSWTGTIVARLVGQGATAPTFTSAAEPVGFPLSSSSAYSGITQLRAARLACEDYKVPQVSLEIEATCWTSGNDDVAPALVAADIFQSEYGLSSSDFETSLGLDGSANSGWERWCLVNDFRVARTINESTPGRDLLEELALDTWSDLIFANGKFYFVPRCGDTVSGNGYTWTPPTAIDLDMDEILRSEGEDPIASERTSDEDVYNQVDVTFTCRDLDYEEQTITVTDDAAAGPGTSSRIRKAPEIRAPWVTTAERAYRLGAFWLKRNQYERNAHTFRLGPRWTAKLHEGDIVRVKDGAMLSGFVRCRIERVGITNGGKGPLEITARELPGGSGVGIDITPEPAVPGAGANYSSGGEARKGLDGKADTDLGNVPDGSVYHRHFASPPADNLIPNGCCLVTDAPSSTFEGAGLFNYGTGFSPNGWYRRLVSAGASLARVTFIAEIQAKAGDGFYFEARGFFGNVIRSSAVKIWVAARNAAGSAVTFSGSAYATAGSTAGEELSCSITCPANTATVDAFIEYEAGKGTAGDTYFVSDLYMRRMVDGSVVADDAITETKIADNSIDTPHLKANIITAAKIAAGEIKTSNYAEDGSGNPTAGAKLDHTGTALKVADGNFQLGTKTLKASAFYNSFHAAFQFKWTPGASNWGSFPWYHNLKRSAYSGDGYQFDNSLGFWVVGFAWPDEVASLSNFSVIPVVSLSSNQFSTDIGDVHPVVTTYSSSGFGLGFKINGNSWWDFRGNRWSVNVIALGYNLDETGTPQ